MNSKKNLVFLGMMGSGKSSIGFLVSKKLKLKFYDIDNMIESQVGKKISIIFKEKGEVFFREIEEEITLRILKTHNNVISLGGGGFLNQKIRNEVLANNSSIWLSWDFQTLLKRIKNSQKRPLVLHLTNQEIKNLIKERIKIYSKAKFKINCNNLTKTEIVNKVTKIYELN